jgi:ribosomal protein S18 acetylase RimI-like enzyme
MKKATSDKSNVIDLLAAAFRENKIVDYIIRKDKSRSRLLRALMDYSFEVYRLLGDVYLSEDRNACVLILFLDQRRVTFVTIWLDIKLILTAIGICGIKKALKRDTAIKSLQPKVLVSYLWFIGVVPAAQYEGTGTALLDELIAEATAINRPVYLETSTERNLLWYDRFGFHIYSELDLDYKLFLLKRYLEKH